MFYEEQRAEHSLQSSFTNPRNSAINIYQRSPSISDRKLSVDTPTSDREVVDINSSCSFSPKELLQQSDDYDDYDEEEEAEDNEEADLVDDELEDKEDSLKHENAILNPIAAIRAAELEQEAVKQEERESQKRLVEESEKLAKERKLQLEQERLAQEAALEEGRKKIEDMKREQRELEELEKRMKEQRAAMRQKLAEEESKMKQEAEIQEKIKQDARSTVNEKVMRQTTIEEGRLQAQAQISDTTIAVGETHDELSVPGQDDNSGANISDDSSAGASEDSSSAGASGDERDSESVKNKETENGNGKFDDVDLFKMEEVDEDESLDVLTEQISSPDPKSTIPHIISSSSSLKERNTENLDEKIVYDGIVSDSQDISNTSNEEAITKPSPQRGRRQPGRGRAARAAPPPPTEDRINTDEYEQLQENLDEVGIVDTIPVSKTPGNSEIMPKEVALRGVDLDVNLTADTDRRSSFSRASTDSAGSAPLSSPSKFKGKRKSAIAAVVQRRDNTKSEVPQMDGPCGDERHTSIDSANDSIELDEKLTASEFSDTDVKGKQALSSTISPPELRGNLQKKSPNVMKGWQKRYAILRAPGELVYYSSVSCLQSSKTVYL